MSKLSKILLVVGVFDLVFIITMIVVFLLTGQEMATLITCVLGASGVEAIVSAIIKVTNINKETKPIRVGDITGFDDAEILDNDELVIDLGEEEAE